MTIPEGLTKEVFVKDICLRSMPFEEYIFGSWKTGVLRKSKTWMNWTLRLFVAEVVDCDSSQEEERQVPTTSCRAYWHHKEKGFNNYDIWVASLPGVFFKISVFSSPYLIRTCHNHNPKLKIVTPNDHCLPMDIPPATNLYRGEDAPSTSTTTSTTKTQNETPSRNPNVTWPVKAFLNPFRWWFRCLFFVGDIYIYISYTAILPFLAIWNVLIELHDDDI